MSNVNIRASYYDIRFV